MMPNYFPRSAPSYYSKARSQVDEEQPKQQQGHTRNVSSSTVPPTTGTTLRSTIASTGTTWKKSHSRSTSDGAYSTTTRYTESNEMASLSSHHPLQHHEKATVFGTGPLVNGPARQVHIRSASRTASIQLSNGAPRLPRLPENVAVIGDLSFYPAPLFTGRRSGHRRSMSTPLSGRSSVVRFASSRTKPTTPLVVQKPLPVTPFPVAAAK